MMVLGVSPSPMSTAPWQVSTTFDHHLDGLDADMTTPDSPTEIRLYLQLPVAVDEGPYTRQAKR